MVTLAAFEAALQAATDAGADLTVDVSEVTFIDAAGLRTLATAAERLHRDGRRLRLVSPSRHLRRLLDVLGLEYLTAPGDDDS